MKRRAINKRLLCGALAAVVAFSGFPARSASAGEDQNSEHPPLSGRLTNDLYTSAGIKENQRKTLDFNTDWLFIRGNDLNAKSPDYDESSAESVSLPHARDTYDLFEPDLDSIQTVDWYRRHFTLSEEDRGDRVFVEFNGGGQVNRVYVNGSFVGEAKGTFTHFKFDITDYVTFGNYDNVIAVQVDSQYHSNELPPGQNIDFHYFGGLHGQASMTLTDNLYSGSVFYYNDDVENGDKTAVLNGKIEVSNQYPEGRTATVRSIIKDSEGNEVSAAEETVNVESLATVQAEIKHTISDPHLWSPDDPYLYTAETLIYSDDICVDQISTTIGIRTLKATEMTESEGYFTLNGERITVIGGNWHMQAPYLGNSRTAKLNEKDAKTLKYDLGINFVRTSHYEADPSFLDACDRLGIMVEEEPLGWNDTPGWDQFCYSMEEMIKRDRNHPSIVVWSIIPNERPLNYPSVAESQERQTVAKELDPSRLTIQEENTNAKPVADIFGWHDYRNPDDGAIKNNPNASSWFVTEWNTNLGQHFVIPGDSETRKSAQVVRDGLKLGQLSSDPRVMGSLKWDLFGYYTPQSAYERGKNVELWRSSGVYGIWRDPLHKTWIAYLLAAQSPNEETTGDILKIASEWKSDSSDTIRVITNLDEVELLYDDGSGTLKQVGYLDGANEYQNMLKNGIFRFNDTGLTWTEDSKLIAKGYRSGSGEAVAEDIVYASTYDTEKDGAYLELHNTIGDIEADGSDVAWILAELKDKNNQREFYGVETVTAEIISGPGTLVYSGDHPTMADGISGFYLRSEQDQTGTTEIRVSADLGENIDDSDTTRISYSGSGWETIEDRADSYQGTLRQTSVAGDSATITFTGNRIIVYSESSNGNGSGTVTLDSQTAGTFTCSNTAKYNTIANQAVYESPILENGTHTLTLTASNGKINIDRIKIFDGVTDVTETLEVNTIASDADRVPCDPSLPNAEMPDVGNAETLSLLLKDADSIDRSAYTASSLAALDDAVDFANSVMEMQDPVDSIINKAVVMLQNALNSLVEQPVSTILHTTTVMEGQSGGVAYVSDADNVWTVGANNTYANKQRSENDYYTITFTGVKIGLYSMLDTAHGIAAVSIDEGQEVEVDQYRAKETRDVLFWESELLEYGTHTVKVRVTGKTSGNPNNACVSFGYARVYENMDETLALKEELAQVMEEASTVDRTAYTAGSLNTMDEALFAAETALTSSDISAEELKLAIASLRTAINELSDGEMSSVTTLTCLDADKAETEGEVGKIYYSSDSPDNWVLERDNDDQLMNRYLKKAATGQENAFASLVFEGTGATLYSRFSATSGWAAAELYDAEGDLVDRQEFSLYDASVTAGNPGTRQAYTTPALTYGTYTLKLIPMNKPDDAVADKSLTSINLAKIEVTVDNASDSPDTNELNALITELNEASLDGKHAQTQAAFKAAVISAVNNSYGLLNGTWPEITISEQLPADTTQARIRQVLQTINEALNILQAPLTVREVRALADITIEEGTAQTEIPFPGQVLFTSSDDQSERINIDSWSCANFDPEVPGEYIFSGQLALPEGLENPDNLTASVKVIVTPKEVEPPSEVDVESVTITGGASEIKVGEQLTLSTEVTPADASYDTVDWAVDGDGVQLTADGGNAVVTGIKEGTATITATISGVSASIEIKVISDGSEEDPDTPEDPGTPDNPDTPENPGASDNTGSSDKPGSTSDGLKDAPPQTGDSADLNVFGMTSVLLLAAGVIVLCGMKRKKKDC